MDSDYKGKMQAPKGKGKERQKDKEGKGGVYTSKHNRLATEKRERASATRGKPVTTVS